MKYEKKTRDWNDKNELLYNSIDQTFGTPAFFNKI